MGSDDGSRRNRFATALPQNDVGRKRVSLPRRPFRPPPARSFTCLAGCWPILLRALSTLILRFCALSRRADETGPDRRRGQPSAAGAAGTVPRFDGLRKRVDATGVDRRPAGACRPILGEYRFHCNGNRPPWRCGEPAHVAKHPGGAALITSMCDRDRSAMFRGQLGVERHRDHVRDRGAACVPI